MTWSTICRENTVLSLQPFEVGTLHPSHPSQIDLQFISLWLFAVVTKFGLFALLYNTTKQFCSWQCIFTHLMFAQHYKAPTWKQAATEFITLSRWQKAINFWPPAITQLVTFRKSHSKCAGCHHSVVIDDPVPCVVHSEDHRRCQWKNRRVHRSFNGGKHNKLDGFFRYFVSLLFDS